MMPVAIEELLKRSGSVYKLVILAAERAKELAQGAPPLVETGHRKVTSIALEEILQGKVLFKDEEGETRAARKGRGAKAREEKKKRVAT